MPQNKTITRKLIFLLLGLLILYLFTKNGNFFPVFFAIASLILIYKCKATDKKEDIKNLLIGVVLAILSLHPIYGICIVLGYVAAHRVFDNSNNKILVFPKEKKEILVYGLLPTFFLILLNSICGNVKKCAVGKHPKSEKLGSTGQAAGCARIHSRYFTGGSPSGLRV